MPIETFLSGPGFLVTYGVLLILCLVYAGILVYHVNHFADEQAGDLHFMVSKSYLFIIGLFLISSWIMAGISLLGI